MNMALTVRNHRKASPMARKKSFAKGLRSQKSSATKRRYGKPGKRHRAGGRYSSRSEAGRSRPLSHPIHDKGYDHSYMEDFKAGFAKGYEDGRQAVTLV